MVHISDELIIFEILTRVSARTVGRSNCVFTGSYKILSTHDRHGFFEHNADAVGLYIDAYDDYKVLHIKRRFGVFDVNAYSRRFESWRNIPFLTRSKYVSPYFSVSSGTFCVDTLYFTVCDCWIGGENVLICFDVNSEIFKEITFPPLASAGMTFGDLVNIKNELYMFVSTGIEFTWVELWMLEDDHRIKSLLFPPIPPSNRQPNSRRLGRRAEQRRKVDKQAPASNRQPNSRRLGRQAER
ncbi:hypothetical protein R6Q57_021891 [Mikania cordata]